MSARLEKDARPLAAKLARLAGLAFGRAYMDTQIVLAQQVLSIIDEVSMPAAHDPDVRSLLADMRDTVAGHLALARRIRAQLG